MEGRKVKKRTIANLSNCTRGEIEAIKLALKYKDNLAILGSIADSLHIQEGQSIGAIWTLYEIARRVGVEKALGKNHQGRLALWQVIARALDQGSRLSAVRLAQIHAAPDVLSMNRGFDENDLYENLTWLCEHQQEIEKRLFIERRGERAPELFLYDVTSSYLEGRHNESADWGYNRDGKKGKMQIVIGLLCDEEGEPISTEVFAGNTQDMATFSHQVKKAAEVFGCKRVTFVGDRGMIKSGQIEDLSSAGFHYITAITKPQVRVLLESGVLQLGMFDEKICEIAHEGVRLILRRNPLRVEELEATRAQKRRKAQILAEQKNQYLKEHPKAKVDTAAKDMRALLARLKVDGWLNAVAEGRSIKIVVDDAALEKTSLLDGCYVIKTDVPATEKLTAQVVHDRYKDLAMVEQEFRTCKTSHLEVRPVYVQTAENTRGHVLVVMLAYMLVRALKKAWEGLDVTVEEGLSMLSTLCSMEVRVNNAGAVHRIPAPREMSAQLLSAAHIRLPKALPSRGLKVVTRHKLTKNRKT